jgi:hypothetical protein
MPPKRKLTAWNIHVKKTFHANRKKNPKYKFFQALKDAKVSWKKK